MYQAPEAPLSIGGVLDSGFKLFRECFTQVFLFPLVLALAVSPANSLAFYFGTNGPPSTNVVVAIVVGAIIVGVLALILTNAVLARIDGIARGAPLTVGQSLSVGASRALSTFVVYLLIYLVVMAVMLVVALVFAVALGAGGNPALFGVLFAFFVIVPLSIIAIWLCFAPVATVLGRLGPINSLRYSRAITRGNWWRTAVLLTIATIILMVIYGAIGLVAGVAAISDLASFASGNQPWYLQFVVTPIASAVAQVLLYSLVLAIFYDLKLRHEGGDLAARIAATA